MTNPKTESLPETPAFSHLDPNTGNARMVNVSQKNETVRTARAVASVRLGAETRRAIAHNAVPKGDVFSTARIGGIMAAKRTSELIPLCHSLPLSSAEVTLTLSETGVEIETIVSCVGRTGVEMEALSAATVAALTVYDMCKSVDKHIVIERIFLAEKTGGKSGPFAWDGISDETDETNEST